jgi:hypothetical protein
MARLTRLLIVWLVGPFPTQPHRPAIGFLEHSEQFEGVLGRPLPLPNLDKAALVWMMRMCCSNAASFTLLWLSVSTEELEVVSCRADKARLLCFWREHVS